jgi:hypothetical protein
MLTPAPNAVARPTSSAVRELLETVAGEDRCERRDRSVDHADERRLDDLEHELVLVAATDATDQAL